MKEEYLSQTGFILKKIPYSDADEIITVILKEQGMRRFFVAGSRKSKKKFQGIIDHFNHLHFHFKSSPNHLWRLYDAELVSGINSHSVWQSQISHYALANYLSELICDFIPEAVTEHDLYLFWLNLESKLKEQNLSCHQVVHFMTEVLSMAGYAVDTQKCQICYRQILIETIYFDYVKGGFCCRSCTPTTAINSQEVGFEAQMLTNDHKPHNDWFRYLNLLVLFSENIMQKKSKSADFLLKTISQK